MGGEKGSLMKLLNLLFGCSHKRCSFPITVKRGQRRNPAASLTGTYVACLKCGEEFPYDGNKMKMVRNRSLRSTVSAMARRRAA